jgi:membrane protease YdiL (CAAX protease family)
MSFEPCSAADPPLSAPYQRAVLPIERAEVAVEVLLCSGFPTQIVIIGLLAMFGLHPRVAGGQLSPSFVFTLTLLDTVLLVGLVVFFFRAHGESLREQLFGSRRPLREAALGVLLIPVAFGVVIAVLLLVQILHPVLRNVPHNPLAELAKSRGNAILFAFVAMVAGGVREEIQRGFVLRRCEQYLGGGVIGLIVFSAVFGLGHLEQGNDVAIATALLGAFWGAIFLRRRSVMAPMVSHSGFNLLQVVKFMLLGG